MLIGLLPHALRCLAAPTASVRLSQQFCSLRHSEAASPAAIVGAVGPQAARAFSVQGLGHGYLGTGGTQQTDEHEPRFLVTGAGGQIGMELVPFLRQRLGTDNIIASDVKTNRKLLEGGPFVYLDVTDKDNLARVAIEHSVTHVVHLATLLSAVGERNPQLALRINTTGITNVLDLAAQHGMSVFAPSTIAVFGSSSPKVNTPDDTITQPSTIYGITKVYQELLGQYYRQRFGVDYRSLRYPGIISAKCPPGGGTTDYAVDIFHKAVREGRFTCFLSPGARLPMLFMPDALEATWQLMMAPAASLTRTTYNVTSMSFSPAELASHIADHVPGFQVTYMPDFRNDIAKTWPDSIDDSLARRDWGWRPRFDLAHMTQAMLSEIRQQVVTEQASLAARQQKQRMQAQWQGAVEGGDSSRADVAAIAIPSEVL